MAIVIILGLFVVPIDKSLLLKFSIGGLLLVAGLSIFLIGVDIGIQPMGERCGSALTRKRSLTLLLSAAFLIGLIVTAAEPDIQVFGDQVRSIFPAVKKIALTFAIAGGVGIFMTVGLTRSILSMSIKWLLLVSYSALFILAYFAPPSFIGIAFDSGGATTGPMTVPFIMALGCGVSAVRADKNGGFGLTGIASVGPVAAVLLFSLFINTSSTSLVPEAASEQPATIGFIIYEAVKEALISIGPLFGLFLLFQFLLLKMTARQFRGLLKGFGYAFLGLTLFLTGVKCGFAEAGSELGTALGSRAAESGGIWYALLIVTGLVLGAIIVCAEPAVWVLSEQVEKISGGTIRRKVLLFFLAAGTAIAIGLAMMRAVSGFSLTTILVPGYALSLILMYFTPELFAGIAFDSGGVASGPLTSTFILSFTLGAAKGSSGGTDSFGVIALVAMMPLIAIQLMGIIYERQRKKANSLRNAAINGGKTK